MVKTKKRMKHPGPQPRMYHYKPVIEATHAQGLVVREQDVKHARRKDPEQCVIARSAVRNLPILSARIGRRIAFLEYPTHYERYSVSAMTRVLTDDFDENGFFTLGKYYLLPPTKAQKLTGKRHSKKGKSKTRWHGKSGMHVMRLAGRRSIYTAGKP